MITSNRKWFSYMIEHTSLSLPKLKNSINTQSYIPSVILDYEGKMYVSDLTNCRRSKKGYLSPDNKGIIVFDFEFKALRKRIKEEGVFRVDLALKLADHEYFSITSSKAIIERKDFEDHWMIIYKNPINCAHEQASDIVVYHNMVKQFTITNVFGHIDNRYQSPQKMSYIDFESIFTFQRLKDNDYKNCDAENIEKWILMDGVQYRADELELPLSTWDEDISPSRNSVCKAINNYSPANKIPFKKLKCNSTQEVKWKCHLGHEWIESVNKITSKNEYSSFCPICETIIPCITLNRDDTEIQSIMALYKFIMKSLKIKKIENIYKTILPLYKETNRLFNKIKEPSLTKWLDTPDNLTINYYFSYPNYFSPKHFYPNYNHVNPSEIDKYISESHGTIEEIEPFLYKATFSSKKKDKLILLDAYPAGINVVNPLNPIDSNYSDNDIYDQYQYRNFMFKYNVIYRHMMLTIIKNSFENKDSIIDPYQYFHDEMLEQYKTLTNDRNEIYKQIEYEGKKLHRWKNEQALFFAVQYLFNDAVFQHHDSSWLGRQSLDIYIPSLKLGIEYQGIQHYEPVSYRGGREQFPRIKELDAKKRNLCKKNKVQLIEWKYTREITLENVKETLKQYLDE